VSSSWMWKRLISVLTVIWGCALSSRHAGARVYAPLTPPLLHF